MITDRSPPLRRLTGLEQVERLGDEDVGLDRRAAAGGQEDDDEHVERPDDAEQVTAMETERSCGTVMWQKLCRRVAPSTRAAS